MKIHRGTISGVEHKPKPCRIVDLKILIGSCSTPLRANGGWRREVQWQEQYSISAVNRRTCTLHADQLELARHLAIVLG